MLIVLTVTFFYTLAIFIQASPLVRTRTRLQSQTEHVQYENEVGDALLLLVDTKFWSNRNVTGGRHRQGLLLKEQEKFHIDNHCMILDGVKQATPDFTIYGFVNGQRDAHPLLVLDAKYYLSEPIDISQARKLNRDKCASQARHAVMVVVDKSLVPEATENFANRNNLTIVEYDPRFDSSLESFWKNMTNLLWASFNAENETFVDSKEFEFKATKTDLVGSVSVTLNYIDYQHNSMIWTFPLNVSVPVPQRNRRHHKDWITARLNRLPANARPECGDCSFYVHSTNKCYSWGMKQHKQLVEQHIVPKFDENAKVKSPSGNAIAQCGQHHKTLLK